MSNILIFQYSSPQKMLCEVCGNNKITKIFFSITFKEKLCLEQTNENRQVKDFDKLTTSRKHSLKHQKYRILIVLLPKICGQKIENLCKSRYIFLVLRALGGWPKEPVNPISHNGLKTKQINDSKRLEIWKYFSLLRQLKIELFLPEIITTVLDGSRKNSFALRVGLV